MESPPFCICRQGAKRRHGVPFHRRCAIQQRHHRQPAVLPEAGFYISERDNTLQTKKDKRMEENTKKNKGGRPRAEIDKTQFEQLCALQCTLVEFCAWFDVADKTLESWCKRTYGAGFYEVFEKKRSKGKISLRRFQFQQAEKNPTMAIWLGKQWLGQSDRMAVKASIEAKTDPLSAAFEALSNETE